MRPAGLRGTLLALLLILAGCGSDGSGSGATPSEGAPATTSAGGPSLSIDCAGQGGPTVVLIAGLDTSGSTFAPLQQDLATTTRTCWYDRAGIGASPPLADGAPDPSPGSAATDLRAALLADGVPPPYVVLGWSYGGLVAQAYADRFPADVAGLVLEDTSVREQFTDPVLMRSDEGSGVVWSEGGRDVDTAALERQLAALDFGAVPLAVLSQDAAGPWGRRWYRYHDELARSSDDGVHVVAVGSGHAVHEDAPAVVLAALRAVWAAAADGAPLGPCDTRLTDPGGRCRTV